MEDQPSVEQFSFLERARAAGAAIFWGLAEAGNAIAPVFAQGLATEIANRRADAQTRKALYAELDATIGGTNN